MPIMRTLYKVKIMTTPLTKTQYTSWQKYLIKALRKISINDPIRKDVFNRARVGKNQYLCATCDKTFPRHECNDDHIDPVICPKEGWQDQEIFFARLFCAIENRQLLCKSCHNEKTKKERAIRYEYRKKRQAEQ